MGNGDEGESGIGSGIRDAQETSRAKRARAKALRLQDLTPGRIKILTNLFGLHWALTGQLHGLAQPDKFIQQTQRDLAWLLDMGFVTRFVARPEQGRASPYGWLLTRAGADIQGEGQHWDNHFLRQPTYYQLRIRENEIALHVAVAETNRRLKELQPGMSLMPRLITPQIFSKAYPCPKYTIQYEPLYDSAFVCEQIIGTIEIARGEKVAGQRRRDNAGAGVEKSEALKGVPAQSNDYVFYIPHSWAHGGGIGPRPINREVSQLTAIVMVLCPPDMSEVFAQGRIEMYQDLKDAQPDFKTVAVFEDIRGFGDGRDPVTLVAHQEFFKEAGWILASLSKLPQCLLDQWKINDQFIKRWVEAQAQIKAQEEAAKMAAQKAEAQRLEQARLEQVRLEQEKLEQARRVEAERQAKEAQARALAAGRARQKEQFRRAEVQRIAAEQRAMAEAAEAQRIAQAQAEAEEIARQEALARRGFLSSLFKTKG